MQQILLTFMNYFTDVMGLSSNIFSNAYAVSVGFSILLMVIGLLGYKLYRVFFSVIALLATILGVVWLFSSSNAWIHVATTFSIASVAVAFAVYFLKRLSAFFVVALIVLGYALAFNLAIVYAILLASGIGVVAYFFPLVMVVLATSLLGAFEGAVLFQATTLKNYYAIGVVLLFFIYLAVQIFSNRSEFKVFLNHRGRQDG